MNLKSMSNAVTRKLGRQILLTQKHSPRLLFGTGVAGFVATVVLASRATLKLEDVLKKAEEGDEQIKHAEAVANAGTAEYTEDDAKKDKILIRTKAAIEVAKLYGPAVAVGVVSVGCLTGSHVILTRRNVGLAAAYAAVEKGFDQYRARVIQELGYEKDQEFRFGSVEREIAVDTDEGTAVKTVKGADPATFDGKTKRSIYARFFDQVNSSEWQAQPHFNAMFLKSQQAYANNLLTARGHLFLNEVYDMLGLERSSEGQLVGWVTNGEKSDGFIDFGFFRGNDHDSLRFVNGDENSIILDFNVDGVVYDLI